VGTSSTVAGGEPQSPLGVPLGIPPANSNTLAAFDPVIIWLQQKVTDGENFLAAQPGWSKIAKSIEAIMSLDDTESVTNPRTTLSTTRTNRIAKITEDLSALQTDTKPFWDYSVANRKFEQHASIYGKLATFWYQHRSVDMTMLDVAKFAQAAGTAYLHIYWNEELGDLDTICEDPRNVIPINPVDYKSLESCQGVILKRKVPVSYIRDRYNLDIAPESDNSGISWMQRAVDTASDIVSPIWKAVKGGNDASEPKLPRLQTVTLYSAQLKDKAVNETQHDIEMGQWRDQITTDETTGFPVSKRVPQNQWSYKVSPGQPLYPHRRLIVWAGKFKLYDGPNFYWHDRFSIIKFTPNPYPWTWLGKAALWDLIPLQYSLNQLLRVIDDHSSQVAQPGSIMDKNNVSKSVYDSFDTRRAGWKVLQNPLAGKGIQIVNPPPLDQAIWAHIQFIIDEMNELAGIKDAARLMDLKQLPSSSSVEAIMNTFTPALRVRSRIMEDFVRNVATQMAFNFTEFYTLPMRVAMLGSGGLTQDDFDFDPGSLLPDHIHSGDYGADGMITPEAFLRGPLPRYDRAKEFMRHFIFKISPGSWLNSAQMEQTLIYFQLFRAGVLDPITLLEKLGVPNIGVESLPDNVRTIIERLKWCQSVGLVADVNAAGRKASGQAPPQIKVSESG